MGALKKPQCETVPKAKTQLKVVDDNIVQKAEIERMKKLITEKIKDPALAKKAAMIITEMLDKK
nr:hypothetical protein BHI3_03630 [Bacteriovorax sp. HI3]